MYDKLLDNGSDDPQNPSGRTDMVQLHGTIVSPPTPMIQTEITAPLSAPLLALKVQPLLGPKQTTVDCPFCQKCVRTTTDNTTTTRTHKLAFKCFWLCCCCLPYCMDSAKNTDHFCPSCKRYLGTYVK